MNSKVRRVGVRIAQWGIGVLLLGSALAIAVAYAAASAASPIDPDGPMAARILLMWSGMLLATLTALLRWRRAVWVWWLAAVVGAAPLLLVWSGP